MLVLSASSLLTSPSWATDCPTPGEPCKVVVLSPQEERALTAPNGILDTAAQGRNLELGGPVVYFKQKIAAAPAGEVKPVEKPAEGGNTTTQPMNGTNTIQKNVDDKK